MNLPSFFFSRSCFIFCVLCILGVVRFPAFAQGDLLIYPKRLVFEGTQNRVQVLNMNNKGKDTATYKLSFIENRMDQDGKFEIIAEPDPDQQFASPYLRFYPRTITLAPNETQVIKVQLIRASDLRPGEYRSHLYLRPVIKAEALEERAGTTVNPNEVSLNLKPVYGISVANIVRVGKPEVQIEVTNMAFEKFNDSIPLISMDFQRSGSASSYGDLSVHHISLEGRETLVGEMKGFAVYTPGSLRKARMKLKDIEGVNYESGVLRLRYVSQDTNNVIYSEVELEL